MNEEYRDLSERRLNLEENFKVIRESYNDHYGNNGDDGDGDDVMM